jgi:glutamate-1-semialdehyde aminotransferase
MFGETLSLAASIATIKKMEREHVIQHLWEVGARIGVKVNAFLDYHGLNDVIQLTGMAPRMKLNFKAHENATANQIKTLFLQNMVDNGVLIINSNNVSFAIKEPEIKRIVRAYDESLQDISYILEGGPEAIAQVIGPETVEFDPLRKS